MGKIEVSKHHILCRTPGNFRISSYLQELMCYFGQQEVFSQAEDTLKVAKGIDVSAKQIENLCHHYGELVGQQMDRQMAESDHGYTMEQLLSAYYVMVDGSMYLTREEQWKEVKLARLFSAQDHIENISKDRGMITDSNYLAHLGSSKEFLLKLEYFLEPLKELVIVADGAKWIWNWAEAFYPDAVQILDYYHAKEHLCQFAVEYFDDQQQRSNWIEQMDGLLLSDKVEQVITTLEQLPLSINKKVESKKELLINYYRNNCHRMCYQTFQQKGYLIGSGPHRVCSQERASAKVQTIRSKMDNGWAPTGCQLESRSQKQ